MALAKLEKTRINNRLPVAREGLIFIIISLSLTLFFGYSGLVIPLIIFGIITLFIIYFFRDPERSAHVPEKAVITPADGRIIDISYIKNNNNPLGEFAIKISVFMSIFNVHVNRVPINGRIFKISYHPGNFFSANLDKASEQNERNDVTLQTDDGRKIMAIQVAGLIARRIACWVREGDVVQAGQRFGLIRFGSRLDVYLPYDSRILVQRRNKVKAGITILGYLS